MQRVLQYLLVIQFAFLLGGSTALAVENASLISVTISNGSPVMPRTMFTQTWTMKNTGTTSWSPGASGCTLNLVGKDTLGALTLFTNKSSKWFTPSAIIASGKTVATNGQAKFSMIFVAPETPGTFTDTFQLNGSGGTNFGPQVTIQVVVQKVGSTNQYDRSKTISYANNYAGYVVTDGYFWTNGSTPYYYGAGAPVPTNFIGDDCAHFVSCCIGQQSATNRGGGLPIPSRGGTYGEPGAGRLVNTVLIGGGYATEVFSYSEMEPGDVIGWNWEGDPNILNLDHVTLYLGNGMVASHAVSALDMSTSYFASTSTNSVAHLIHIFDAPTLLAKKTGSNLVLSWTTNWTGYTLYSSTSMATNGTWTKIAKSPSKIGATYVSTNAITSGAHFYRLSML